MNNEIANPKSFDDRMLDMFRTNLGSLMTEEELKKIAERSLETLFFKERPGEYRNSNKPPLALELLTPEVTKLFEGVMQKWIADNHEQIMEQFTKHFGATAEEFALKMIGNMFGPVFDQMRSAISSETFHMIQNNRPNGY